MPWNRSPGLIFVDLPSVFQAGAVGHVPGANFGRKLTKNRENKPYIYIGIGIYVYIYIYMFVILIFKSFLFLVQVSYLQGLVEVARR